MRARLSPFPLVSTHQGGWDEILMVFGLPAALFVLMRRLGERRDRRERAAAAKTPEEP